MGKGNPWIEHVMQTRKAAGNKGKSFKEILKIAKKTYKKSPAAHKKAHKKGAKENTLSYWAGYALTANEVSNFRQKLEEANQNLVMSVGEFSPTKLNAAEVYDLAGNVAEYDQKGGTYGYSAYDYVDPHDPAVQPMKVGFRVVKQKK